MVFNSTQKIAADMACYCYGYFVCWNNVASRKSLRNYRNRDWTYSGSAYNVAGNAAYSIPLQEEVALQLRLKCCSDIICNLIINTEIYFEKQSYRTFSFTLQEINGFSCY